MVNLDALARRAPNVARVLKAAPKASARAADKATNKAASAAQSQAANDGGAAASAGDGGPGGGGDGDPDGDGDGAANQAPAPKKKGGVLTTIGKGIAAMTALEKLISSPFAKIPFPGFPALAVGDISLGQPHPHGHPPNVVGPGPPIPLAGCGPVLPIPYLSGAERVLTGCRPAARCGDMGLGMAPWCGGFFPFFEIWFGSASVWIEGARAARTAVDITRHCMFSAPKPKDQPLGPFLGATATGNFSVLIGGIPMPSLVSLAIGGALKLAFKGVGAVFKGISSIARRSDGIVANGIGAKAPKVSALERVKGALKRPFTALKAGKAANARISRIAKQLLGPDAVIKGPLAFRKRVLQDLLKIRKTKVGRQLLDDLKKAGKPIEIHHKGASRGAKKQWKKARDSAKAMSGEAYRKPDVVADGTPGAMTFKGGSPFKGQSVDWQAVPGPRGKGAGTRVVTDPDAWAKSKNMPSDVVMFHELNHARNNALGNNMAGYTSNNPSFNRDWHNIEEFNTVGQENIYRAQRNAANAAADQVPHRGQYVLPPGWFK